MGRAALHISFSTPKDNMGDKDAHQGQVFSGFDPPPPSQPNARLVVTLSTVVFASPLSLNADFFQFSPLIAAQARAVLCCAVMC